MSLSRAEQKRRATAERTRKWRDRKAAEARQAQEAETRRQQAEQAAQETARREAEKARIASVPKRLCEVANCGREANFQLNEHYLCSQHGTEMCLIGRRFEDLKPTTAQDDSAGTQAPPSVPYGAVISEKPPSEAQNPLIIPSRAGWGSLAAQFINAQPTAMFSEAKGYVAGPEQRPTGFEYSESGGLESHEERAELIARIRKNESYQTGR